MLRLTQSIKSLSLLSGNVSQRAFVRVPVQLRTFTSSPVAFNAYGESKPVKKATPKKAKKAKSKATPTESQIAKALAKKEKAKAVKKEKKAKELNQLKKDEKRATSKPVKRSGFNIYVSENYSSSLKETVAKYSYLTDSEKKEYNDKAAKFNDEKLAEFSEGKPTKPISSYANFTKQNYATYKTDDMIETSKILKDKWNQLTSDEKKEYSAVSFDPAEYKSQLKAWKEKRLAAYLAEKSAENAKRREAAKSKKST